MKNRYYSLLIALAWVGVFGFLIYKELYTVAILSFILLGMILAFSTSNDN